MKTVAVAAQGHVLHQMKRTMHQRRGFQRMQQRRFVKCVVTKQKAITLVACAVNHAKHSLDEQCKGMDISHFSASMASLVLFAKKTDVLASTAVSRNASPSAWRKVRHFKNQCTIVRSYSIFDFSFHRLAAH